MKHLVALLLAFASLSAFAQVPSIGFTGPLLVTEGSANGSTGPRVTVTGNDVPLIMWGKSGSTGGIFTTRLENGVFTTPAIISPAGVPIRVSSYDGPDMEARGDTAFITYINTPFAEAKVYTQRSLDGGITWDDSVRVDSDIQYFPYSPNIFVRPNGDPVVTYERANASETIADQNVTYSSDMGLTWSQDVGTSLNLPLMPCECCPPAVVAYGSTVVAIWRYNDNNVRDIYTAISQDNGDNFTSYVRVDSADWLFSQCPATGPDAMMTDDSLYIVFKTAGTWEDRVNIVSIHKTNFGVSNQVELDSDVAPGVLQNYPRIAGSGDTIGVVWQDNRNGNLDVFFKYSVSGPSGFSQTINLIDSTMPSSQVNPHIAYANGTFHIVFQSQNSKVYYYGATVGATTAVKESHAEAFGISVSPNPLTDQSTIQINKANGAVALSLYDLKGQLVLDIGSTKNKTIKMQAGKLSAGIYILRAVSSSGQEAEQKIVIR
jgi:hypothetical protein